MKKVIVTKNNGATYGAELEDPTEWIESCISNNSWGLPERDVLDEEGNPTGEKLPAEYTIEITDITHDHALQVCINNRVLEYPTAEEFLNAYFDGGEIAVQELQNKRLQIKAKYPKPTIPQE